MQHLPLASLSILVVEDEPLLRKQIAAYLERLGADVTATDTLERSRKLAHDLPFDFALAGRQPSGRRRH